MMNLPSGTNIVREWGFGKCWPYCNCGWTGRERKLTDANRLKARDDIYKHVKVCKEKLSNQT
jgi:hypothetical protein